MKTEIAKKLKTIKPKTLSEQAAEKFCVSKSYVEKIIYGYRDSTRGKAKEIKQWLLEQIEINKTNKNN